MLSILIPTYNYICVPLVESLYSQIFRLNVHYEIIVADDGSEESIKNENRKLRSIPGCRYVELKENIGPARIRNYLGKQASGNYLLFLDADALPVNDSFLEDYLEYTTSHSVVCGGLRYKKELPPINKTLRYYYGINVEERNAIERNKEPYKQFSGISFLISKEVFYKVHFDDSFGFGYEDTYFGMNLERNKVNVVHIDNPVWHPLADTNEDYLRKIRTSLINLAKHESCMKGRVRLLNWYNQLSRFRLTGLAKFLFIKFEKSIERNLTGPKPSLEIFAFYKLGYLITILPG